MKKNAIFDLDYQNENLEAKIVVGLERIAEAFRVLLWQESKEFSLSPIQIQILIFLQAHSIEKCKVGYLAQEFNLTKPTVSDAVKILEQKQLIRKETEPNDNRSYTIHLTEAGKKIARKTAHFAAAIQQPLNELHPEHKVLLLESLMHLIHQLNKNGVITLQRMCQTCRFYSKNQGGQAHYCHFLKKPLSTVDLRIDCPEHELLQ